MVASAYPQKTPGSVLSGIPFSLAYYERYASTFVDSAIAVIDEVISAYEDAAKAILSQNEQWAGYSDSVSFEVDVPSSSIYFSAPSTVEYGDRGLPPSGVLRTYADKAERDLPGLISKVTHGVVK